MNAEEEKLQTQPKELNLELDSTQEFNLLIKKILSAKNIENENLIKKHNETWVLNMINGEIMVKIERIFSKYQGGKMDMVQFLKEITKVLNINKEYQIYAMLGIVDLFKDIVATYSLADAVSFKNLTDYLIDVNFDGDKPLRPL